MIDQLEQREEYDGEQRVVERLDHADILLARHSIQRKIYKRPRAVHRSLDGRRLGPDFCKSRTDEGRKRSDYGEVSDAKWRELVPDMGASLAP